jgi:gliding motility-associated-like protein
MLTTTEVNPSFSFSSDSGSVYNVCLAAQNVHGCYDTVCHEVIIEEVYLIYTPNAFTPNGDGLNDIFLPFIQGEAPETYELMIFDRWGEMIFRSTDELKGWDGTHKNMKAKEDVYVWKIKVKEAKNSKKHEHVGHVTLLR